jgi:hypothetical protein
LSHSYSATVTKPAQVKDALKESRNRQAQQTRQAAGDQPGVLQGQDPDRLLTELDDVAAAADKGAEAIVRALDGSSFQIAVSGNRDLGGELHVAVSVSAIP